MFEGVYTALATPFKTNEELDFDALDKLVDFQIKGGVNGLVPMGTTGESPTVNHKENLEVVERVVKKADGKLTVIAGTGSNSTDEAVRMTRIARDIGADASLQVAPYYNKPTQEGLYRHYMTIADAVDMPVMVYNIKGRTGVNIETATLMRMAKHPNIVAVKEASGDVSQMMDVIGSRPNGFAVLSGDDNLALPLTLLGGNGVVSVASNIVPDRMVSMIAEALAGNMAEARTMHYGLLSLFASMFIETNPIPVKYCLAEMGILEAAWRLPLCPPGDKSADALREMLKSQGITTISS